MTKRSFLNLSIKLGAFDLLVISPTKISLYHIKEKKSEAVVKTKFEYPNEIFSKGILNTSNLEKSLINLKNKHKDLIEAGIILHLPGLIFQKIQLPTTKKIRESLINYLQTNFPLPLQKYYIFSRMESENLNQNDITLSTFFIRRQIIDSLLIALEKAGIVPLFAIHSFNALDVFAFDYFTTEANTDYVFFVQTDKMILSSWIKNYQHQKVLIEEIGAENNKFAQIISYYSQLISDKKKEFILVSDEEIPKDILETYHIQQIYKNIDSFWATVGKLAKSKIGKERLIDILPARPSKIFFLNRIIPVFRIASLFTLLLIIISTGSNFTIQKFLQNKISTIETPSEQIVDLSQKENLINNLNNLLDIYLRREQNKIDVNSILKIAQITTIKQINSNLNQTKIWVIINKEEEEVLNIIKNEIPKAKTNVVEEQQNNLIVLIEF